MKQLRLEIFKSVAFFLGHRYSAEIARFKLWASVYFLCDNSYEKLKYQDIDIGMLYICRKIFQFLNSSLMKIGI